MTWISSAFGSDHVHLTRWDLLKLLFGMRLKDGACVVECKPKKLP